MAVMFAKTYVIPTITRVRSTCIGTQYVLETPEYLDIVTVNGNKTTCTCGEANCSHIQAVNRRRVNETQEAAKREAYCSTFDLSYGDAA